MIPVDPVFRCGGGIRRYGIPLCFFLLFLAPMAWSWDGYGRIVGRVYDAKTGAPLPYANLILQGTVLGTASDANGLFVLDKVPRGRYTLQVTMMGYRPLYQKDVVVTPNEAIELRLGLIETAIQVPGLVVTASKQARRLEETPVSLSTLSARDLEQQRSVYLDQLLEKVPGVHLMSGQVNIRGSSGFSYGVGSRVLFLVDGVPLLGSETGDIKWDIIPSDQIERIEIVKSAGSALYGSSALGGVIQVFTRELSTTPETRVRMSGGFYDDPPWPEWKWTDRVLTFFDLECAHARPIGKVKTSVSLGRHQSDGYRQNGGYQKYNASTKVLVPLGLSSRVTLQGLWEGGRSDVGVMWQTRRRALSVAPAAVGDHSVSNRLALHALHDWTINQKTGAKTRFSWFKNHFENRMHDNRDWATSHRIGTEIQITRILSNTHTLVFGTEETLDQVTAHPLGSHTVVSLSGYLQDDLRFSGSLTASLGLRFDHAITDGDLHDNRLSPKAGLVWRLGETISLRAASGSGFRVPSLYERFPNVSAAGLRVVPNPTLRPETAWTNEIGLAYFNSALRLDVAVFTNVFRRLIEPVPDVTNTIRFVNLTSARISGLETTVQFAAPSIFSGEIGYTYLDTKDQVSREPLAYRPRHLVRLSVTGSYRFLEAGIDYVYNDRLRLVKLYPYDPRVAQKTLDGRVGLSWNRWSVRLHGNNLLNHMHTQVERTIMPIRNFSATVVFKW